MRVFVRFDPELQAAKIVSMALNAVMAYRPEMVAHMCLPDHALDR